MQGLVFALVVTAYVAACFFQLPGDENFAVRFCTITGKMPAEEFSKSLQFIGWLSRGIENQWIFQKLAPFLFLLVSSAFFSYTAEKFLARAKDGRRPQLFFTWMLLCLGCLVYAQIYSFDYVLSGIILGQWCAGFFLIGQINNNKIFFWLGLVCSIALIFFRFPLGVALGIFFIWRICQGSWQEKILFGVLLLGTIAGGLRVLSLEKLPILENLDPNTGGFWDYIMFLFRRYVVELGIITGLIFFYRLIPDALWKGWWSFAFAIYGLGAAALCLPNLWLAGKFGWYATKTIWFLFPLIATIIWSLIKTRQDSIQKVVLVFFSVILIGSFVGTHARWVNYSLNFIWCLGFLAALLLPNLSDVKRALAFAARLVALSYFLYFAGYAGKSWVVDTYYPVDRRLIGWVMAEATNIRDAKKIAQGVEDSVHKKNPLYFTPSVILPATLLDMDFQVIPQGEILTRIATARYGIFIGTDTPAEKDYYRKYPAISFQEISQKNPTWELKQIDRFFFLRKL